MHPSRVERVGMVIGKGWPALAGSVPCPYHLKEGTTTRKGRGRGRGGQDGRPSRRCPAVCGLLVAGAVVAIASTRSGRGGRPSLSLSADRSGRSGERLAMVWTVKTSYGAEERRGTGEDVGGILRPCSLSSWSFVSFALPQHMKEENEEEAGRMAERRGAAIPFPACFCSFSIYNKV